jgi:hypothetical protein
LALVATFWIGMLDPLATIIGVPVARAPWYIPNPHRGANPAAVCWAR